MLKSWVTKQRHNGGGITKKNSKKRKRLAEERLGEEDLKLIASIVMKQVEKTRREDAAKTGKGRAKGRGRGNNDGGEKPMDRRNRMASVLSVQKFPPQDIFSSPVETDAADFVLKCLFRYFSFILSFSLSLISRNYRINNNMNIFFYCTK